MRSAVSCFTSLTLHASALAAAIWLVPAPLPLDLSLASGRALVLINSAPSAPPEQATPEVVIEVFEAAAPVTLERPPTESAEVPEVVVDHAPEAIAVATPPTKAVKQETDHRPTGEQVPQPIPRQAPPPLTPITSAAAAPALAAVVEAGARIDLPQKHPGNPPPHYPADALLRRIEGRVIVRAWVSAEGLVDRVALGTSSGFAELDASALQAVQRWKFHPARRNGVALAYEVNVPVRFALRKN